jgi:hypothetical protein
MPLVNPAFRAVGSISPARFVAPASTADFSVMSAGVSLAGCVTTNTSASVTVPANTIPNGSLVSGTGIPAGAFVLYGGGTTTLVLSAAATASGTVALTFFGKPIGISQDGSKFPQTEDGWGSGATTVAAEDGDQLLVYGLGEVCLLEVDSSGTASPASSAPPIVAGDWLVPNSSGKGVKFTTNGGNGIGDNLPTHVGAIALESPTTGSGSSLIRVQVVNFTVTQ